MKQSTRSTLLLLLSLGVAPLCAQQTPALTLQKTIPLPGITGKFDHFALDAAGNRLFASATGSHTVVVLDLATGKIAAKLEGLGKPHGLAWIPETGRLFVTDGARGELAIYAGSPLKRIQTLPLAEDADDVVYDPATKLLYAGFGGTNAANPSRIAVVDTTTLQLLSSVPVPTHPEGLELDPSTDRIFANIADSAQVVVLDGKTHQLAATWHLHTGKDNTPLVFDAVDNLLLVGCRTPAEIVVLNATTGTEGATMKAATGADDLFYDPSTRHAFLITGAGTVDSFALAHDGSLTQLPPTPTQPGAKTGYLDQPTGRLFIGVPGTTGPSSIRIYATH
jgi:hypothetical protein